MTRSVRPSSSWRSLQQVDDLGLDRDVERGDGLVGDDQLGLQRERAGDADALPLAAGERVGEAVGRRLRAARRGRAARRTRARRSRATADAVRAQRLLDDLLHLHARVQRRVRVLEDHLRAAAEPRAARARRARRRRRRRTGPALDSGRYSRSSVRPSVVLPQPGLAHDAPASRRGRASATRRRRRAATGRGRPSRARRRGTRPPRRARRRASRGALARPRGTPTAAAPSRVDRLERRIDLGADGDGARAAGAERAARRQLPERRRRAGDRRQAADELAVEPRHRRAAGPTRVRVARASRTRRAPAPPRRSGPRTSRRRGRPRARRRRGRA